MEKERVHEIVSGIDPTLVEEADGAGRGNQKHLPRLARTGLIAACLCAALLGTAAAGVASGWIRISDAQYGSYRDGQLTVAHVEVAIDGTSYIPLENFSQQSRDYANSFLSLPQYKGFDSWDEAEEFLGINIADNPVLDAATLLTQYPSEYTEDSNLPSVGHRIKSFDEPTKCSVMFEGRTDSPSRIWLRTQYQFGDIFKYDEGNFTLSVHVDIITQPTTLKERHGGITFRDCDEPVTEEYTTPSGLQTVIVTAHNPEYDTTDCFVYFQLNGANFALFSGCAGDGDWLVSEIKEILDAYS